MLVCIVYRGILETDKGKNKSKQICLIFHFCNILFFFRDHLLFPRQGREGLQL